MDLKLRFSANPLLKGVVFTLMLSILVLPIVASAAPTAPGAGKKAFLPVVGRAGSPLSISVSASPQESTPDSDVAVSSQFSNRTASHIDVDVTLIVRTPGGIEILRQEHAGQCLDPGKGGQTLDQLRLDASAAEGTYAVGVELQDTKTGNLLFVDAKLNTFTVRKKPATAYSLSLSKSSNRSNPVGLEGETLSGGVYIFLNPGSGAKQVRFYLDNPSAAGTPAQTENGAPYDFAGGSAEAANAYDTTKLANGTHTITAAIDLSSGGTSTVTSTFAVNNGTAPPPPPPPTPPPSSGSIYWGISMQGIPWETAKLENWERNVAGKPVSIIHWGHKWGDSSGNYKGWSNGALDTTRAHGSIPMISWTPEGGDPSRWQLRDIINGSHDAYIRQFAQAAKAWAKPFFLRIMHEMNGDFNFPWQEMENGNSRGEYVPAWRHIVDIFRAEGVTNASYVWCPNVDFYPNSPRPSYASLYPGDSYVDWSCLDGYNWGGVDGQWTGWESWDQVFEYSYGKLLEVAPSKPVMIGEFGSEARGAPSGQSKAAWFTNALKTEIPGQYNRIRAIVYFNWQMDGANWLIEENAETQAAWRSGISSSYYLPDQFGSITGKVAVP